MVTATLERPQKTDDEKTANLKYILVDVDDCILPTNGEDPPGFHEGLAQLHEWFRKLRGRIGFCTGRDRNYVEAISFCLGLPDSWSVIESGVALFNPSTKEMRFNPSLTPAVRNAFLPFQGMRTKNFSFPAETM